MPVGTQSSAGPLSQKLAFEPKLQAKKRIDPPFLSQAHTISEPALQSKKRVRSGRTDFTQTAVVNSSSEPALQSKRKVHTQLTKTTVTQSPEKAVAIQSKKKIEPSESEKPIQSEPPLQSKRRAPGPPTTLSNGFYEKDNGFRDDYALLGNQDKFKENVKYRVRSSHSAYRDISPPKQMKIQKSEKENQFYKTAPAPVVNVDQFRQPPTPLAPRKPKEQTFSDKLKESNVEPIQKQPKVLRNPQQSGGGDAKQRKARTEEKEGVASQPRSNEKSKSAFTPSQSKPAPEKKKVTTVSTSTATEALAEIKANKLNLEEKEGMASQPSANEKSKSAFTASQSKPVPEKKKVTTKYISAATEALAEIKANKLNLEEVKNLDHAEPMKSSLKDKRIMNMNEFAQTNMEKGIADSAPEAPADYALKYKTGIAPPRPTKKVTEYQKQFAWRSGLPSSPLLTAEQVVYNSNPQLSPPKKDLIRKVTEYQKQFKAPKLVPVPKDDIDTPRKIAKLQRSKSMEDMSPAQIPTAGSSPVIAPDNKRLTLETNQKQKPEPVPDVPKRKPRHQCSEYKNNFKSPTKFDYLRGSWQGANPPQIAMQVTTDTATVPALSNWFSEVLELRRKAGEYRQRALGTHFSREHMLQLMAQQTDMWDASTTTARSTLSALSLESGQHSQRDVRSPVEKAGKFRPRRAGSTDATMASEDEHTNGERFSDSEESPPQKKLAWTSEEEQPDTPSTMTEILSGEGRLTTPNLYKKMTQSSSARRHHLDRTTPSVGGALLSSPPSFRKKRSGKKMVSKSVDSISLGSVDDVEPEQPMVHKPLAGQKTYTKDEGFLAPTPTFGMPSRDYHFLRDDELSTDQELHTHFVHNPAKGRGLIRGSLDVIDEGFGQTYNKLKPDRGTQHEMSWTIDGGMKVPRVDEDALSVSVQSIASSCSVASDTLERARKRKEEFWGKNGIVSK